jgi:hypothetical protein
MSLIYPFNESDVNRLKCGQKLKQQSGKLFKINGYIPIPKMDTIHYHDLFKIFITATESSNRCFSLNDIQ